MENTAHGAAMLEKATVCIRNEAGIFFLNVLWFSDCIDMLHE